MSNPSTDSIGNQIISKHAPFFKPGDMAAAIDEAINREKVTLLDDLIERVANPAADTMTMEDFRGRADMVARGTYNFIHAHRTKLTKGSI